MAETRSVLGETQRATEHLALAELACADLPVDGYGDLVRSGIAALRDRLSTSD